MEEEEQMAIEGWSALSTPWACPVCTFVNESTSSICGMCEVAMHVPSSAVRGEREERREVPMMPAPPLSDILGRIQSDLESQSVQESQEIFERRPLCDGHQIGQFPWADLPAELQERILSVLDLRSVGMCSQVDSHMNQLTNNSSLWSALYIRRWGDNFRLPPGLDTCIETSKKELYKLRHIKFGDWTFGHYTLSSFAIPEWKKTEERVLRYIEEDDTLFIGYPKRRTLKIWDCKTGECTQRIIFPFANAATYSKTTRQGSPFKDTRTRIQTMAISKEKIALGHADGVVVFSLEKKETGQDSVTYAIRSSETFSFQYVHGYMDREAIPSWTRTSSIAVSSNAVAFMHDNGNYLFLTQGDHDEHGQVRVTRIALGDNPSEKVLMHLDTVELEDCKAAIRLTAYFPKSQLLHVFVLKKIGCTPGRKAILMPINEPKQLCVSGDHIALLSARQMTYLQLDHTGLINTQPVVVRGTKFKSMLRSNKLLQMDSHGRLVLYDLHSEKKIAENYDFLTENDHESERDLRLTVPYIDAQPHNLGLVLLTETGIVRRVKFSSEAATLRQVNRFKQIINGRTATNFGKGLILEDAQLKDDATIYLLHKLRQIKSDLVQLSHPTPIPNHLLCNDPIQKYLEPEMKHIEEVLTMIKRDVSLNNVHYLYSELVAILESNQKITDIYSELQKIESNVCEIKEGGDRVPIKTLVAGLLNQWTDQQALRCRLEKAEHDISGAAPLALPLRTAQLHDALLTVGQSITQTLDSAMTFYLNATTVLFDSFSTAPWTALEAREAKDQCAVLDTLLECFSKHLQTEWPNSIKLLHAKIRLSIVNYQQEQYCLKLAIDFSTLTSVEVTRDKLAELLEFWSLHVSCSGLSTTELESLNNLIVQLRSILGKQIDKKIMDCWVRIQQEASMSSQHVVTVANELLAVTNSCSELLDSRKSHFERTITLIRDAEIWLLEDISHFSASQLEKAIRHASELYVTLNFLEDSPTRERLMARELELKEALTDAKAVELASIHRQIDEIEHWLGKQKKLVEEILSGSLPQQIEEEEVGVMSLSKKRPKLESGATQSTGAVSKEQLIERIIYDIHQRITILSHHPVRSTEWFKIEERCMERMNKLTHDLKHATSELRRSLFLQRLERVSSELAGKCLDEQLAIHEEFKCFGDPDWFDDHVRGALRRFLQERIEPSIAENFISTLAGTLTRFRQAMISAETSEGRSSDDSFQRKKMIKVELNQLKTLYVQVVANVLHNDGDMCQKSVAFVDQLMELDGLQAEVNSSLKSWSDMYLYRNLRWMYNQLQKFASLAEAFSTAQLPTQLQSDCSAARERCRHNVHNLNLKITTTEQMLYDQITKELDRIEDLANQKDFNQTPKEIVQTLYRQFDKLNHESFKLRSWEDTPSQHKNSIKICQERVQALEYQLEELLSKAFLLYLQELRKKANQRDITRYKLERLKSKLDKQLSNYHSCHRPGSEVREVANIKLELDLLIAERISVNWYRYVIQLAGDILKAADDQSLQIFTSLYADIENLKQAVATFFSADLIMDLNQHQERINDWTVSVYSWDIPSSSDVDICELPISLELQIVKQRIDLLSEWTSKYRRWVSNTVSVDEQIENLTQLRDTLENFNHHKLYMQLAEKLEKLESTLYTFLDDRDVVINDVKWNLDEVDLAEDAAEDDDDDAAQEIANFRDDEGEAHAMDEAD